MRQDPIRVRQALGGCLAVIALLSITTTARASLLIPNGNPTHANPAVAANGSSTLDPAPAIYVEAGNCPWLIPGLEAQGYTAANNWTINTMTLDGTITLDVYRPWVNTEPAITQGAFSFPATANFGNGGATIGLSYQASTDDFSNDPQGGAVHWVQVIRTNQPSGFGTTNGVAQGGGYTIYIDNGYNSPTVPNNPWYDSGYAADSTDFVDVPSRGLANGVDWEAQVFIATWQPVNANDRTQGGTITIFDGVWWGFELAVPEPATFVLITIGAAMILAVYRRRR